MISSKAKEKKKNLILKLLKINSNMKRCNKGQKRNGDKKKDNIRNREKKVTKR